MGMNTKSSPSLRLTGNQIPKDYGLLPSTVQARKSVIETGIGTTAPEASSQTKERSQREPKEVPADAWPQLKRVEKIAAEGSWHVADTSAPWSRHALREVQGHHHHEDHSPRRHDTPDLFKMRQQLRKVQSPEPLKAVKLPTPPLSQWRRSPGRLTGSPQTQMSKDVNCGNCNPSETTSSAHEESPMRVIMEEDDVNSQQPLTLMQKDATNLLSEANILPTPSRLRLRDLEQTLARHSAEDLQSLQGGKASSDRRGLEMTTPLDVSISEGGDAHIHNPRPFLPPDHACEWRARCMDLNSEVEQLKSEMSEMESIQTFEQRSEPQMRGYISVGVGDAVAQHDCREFGIEGLTIVLHMRGKDDLVINTDLENGSQSCWP